MLHFYIGNSSKKQWHFPIGVHVIPISEWKIAVKYNNNKSLDVVHKESEHNVLSLVITCFRVTQNTSFPTRITSLPHCIHDLITGLHGVKYCVCVTVLGQLPLGRQ